MEKNMAQIDAYISSCRDELIEFWKELVNFQAGSHEVQRVEELILLTKRRFEQEGLCCQLIPSKKAPVLVAVDGPDRAGQPILFGGHLDTVFPSGTYPDNPFKIEDGIAYGPGVLDMKGGVAMMLYIVKALRHIGFHRNPVKIVLCGDEEIAHTGSGVEEILQQQAAGCLCAFNMEIGRMDNCLSVGRKGSVGCHITVTGKGGHVGNDFLAGRNAIEEMAHKVIALQALSRYDDGIVVSVDVIHGGTVSNAIPDSCSIEVDARFSHASDLEVIKKQITDVCSVTHVEGTRTTVEFAGTMPVFEKTDANMAMLDRLNRVAAEYGLAPLGAVLPGGNSDISYISMMGVPAICSCGVRGSGAHTLEEQALVETIFERTKIIASAIAQWV